MVLSACSFVLRLLAKERNIVTPAGSLLWLLILS